MNVFGGLAPLGRRKRFAQVVQRDGAFRFEDGFEE